MDYAIQRKNMVESQVRPSDVTDRRIIRAMLELPREMFVAERYRALAYMDGAVPLEASQGSPRRVLLPARILAKLLQAGEVDAAAAVLVVGAGTGYGAAVLSRLAASVVALESDGKLLAAARSALGAIGISNVSVAEGALPLGKTEDAPYDLILIEGAVDSVPPALLDQLKDGGKLIAIVGRGATGQATVWQRSGSTFGAKTVFDASADLLPGFEKTPAFAF